MGNFVSFSLETHLFFARIMREHAFFLEAGFPCTNEAWIKEGDWFREQFENLLRDVVAISDRRVSEGVIRSGELVTEFTIPAEIRTGNLSGVAFDRAISEAEHRLRSGCMEEDEEFVRTVRQINARSLWLLDGLISFKEGILREVGKGCLFNANYPLLIRHILREAKMYRELVRSAEKDEKPTCRSILETEAFWNRIMMEHAMFIRGLLDPSEEKLMGQADEFAEQYRKLLETARRQDCRCVEELTKETIGQTQRYREFKAAGAAGILNCEIASSILPLLADHVLREANHYLRLLEAHEDGREN